MLWLLLAPCWAQPQSLVDALQRDDWLRFLQVVDPTSLDEREVGSLHDAALASEGELRWRYFSAQVYLQRVLQWSELEEAMCRELRPPFALPAFNRDYELARTLMAPEHLSSSVVLLDEYCQRVQGRKLSEALCESAEREILLGNRNRAFEKLQQARKADFVHYEWRHLLREHFSARVPAKLSFSRANSRSARYPFFPEYPQAIRDW